MSTIEEPTEADFKKLLNRLRSKEPNWKEMEEFGKLLMIRKDDFTPDQLKRYNELKEFLKK